MIKPRLTTPTRLPDTNRTRLVRKSKPTDSFFNFFSPPVPPTDEAIENGEIEEDDLTELEEKLEVDYQIGEDLKEKVWCSLSEFYCSTNGIARSFLGPLTTSQERLSNTKPWMTMKMISTKTSMMMTTMTKTRAPLTMSVPNARLSPISSSLTSQSSRTRNRTTMSPHADADLRRPVVELLQLEPL